MIAGTVWNQLVTTLQGSGLLSYMKYVYEGRRFPIEPESLPCLMLEPRRNNDINRDLNQIKDIFLSIDIFAFSSANYNEFPKTIVGDQNYRGILGIENDIKACLQRSYTLGNNVIDIQFEPTIFDEGESGKYPVRGLVMPIKILYRQINEA